MDRGQALLDSAGFWTGWGAGLAVVGGILVGIGNAEATNAKAALWSNGWFLIGLIGVVVGGLMLLWALVLFVAHRHASGDRARGRADLHGSALKRVPGDPPAGFNYEREWRLSQVRENNLQVELMEWGNDRPARRYLRQVIDRLPALPVGFAKDFAGLLHAAYQEPFNEYRVVLTTAGALASGDLGTVLVPDIKREITFPMETAKNVHKLMEEMIKTAKNDRARDAGLSAPAQSE